MFFQDLLGHSVQVVMDLFEAIEGWLDEFLKEGLEEEEEGVCGVKSSELIALVHFEGLFDAGICIGETSFDLVLINFFEEDEALGILRDILFVPVKLAINLAFKGLREVLNDLMEKLKLLVIVFWNSFTQGLQL